MCALWFNKKEDAPNEQVLSVLSNIFDQRIKLVLEVEGHAEDIKANLIELSDTDITLEVLSLKAASDTWAGHKVSCFFFLRNQGAEGGEQVLGFASSISSVQRSGNGRVHFVLPFPRTISNAQRRRSVRIKVSPEKVQIFKLWHKRSLGVTIPDTSPCLDKQTNGARGFKVGNISASGVQLQLQDALMQKVLPKNVNYDASDIGKSFCFYLKAVPDVGSPTVSVWVTAVLRHIVNLHTNETSLGFELVAEGVMGEDRKLVWKSLKHQEVGGLSKLLFKWSLDSCRTKSNLS